MESLILTFHGVGPVSRALAPGEGNCWLDQGFFEAVLDLVRDHRHVGLTVDDGNLSDMTHILPALAKRGLRARFFVCSGRLNRPGFVGPAQLRELLAEGMSVGSHGVAHAPWRSLSAPQLREELQTSRVVLQSVCGTPIDEAACPFGSYDRKVLAELRQAGYRRVYSSDGGMSDGRSRLLPRTTVTRLMSLAQLRKLCATGPGVWAQSAIRAKRFCKALR